MVSQQTVLRGAGRYQFGKTLGMRFGFVSVWNWCSSQPILFPSMDAAIDSLDDDMDGSRTLG